MATRFHHMSCALICLFFAAILVLCAYRDRGFCATFVDVMIAVLLVYMAREHDAERMAIRDQQAEDAQ